MVYLVQHNGRFYPLIYELGCKGTTFFGIDKMKQPKKSKKVHFAKKM